MVKNKMATKPSLYTFFRALVLICFAIFLARFSYENRCHLISCSPASWEQILDLALAHSGQDFSIESVTARPAFWTGYTDTGPTFVLINVTYVSPNVDSSHVIEIAGKSVSHPVKHLEFDDQSLMTAIEVGHGWSSSVPPENRQEVLQRVRVHPRDVFRTTWALAMKESGLSSDKINAFATLFFDTQDHESIWRVTYVYDSVALEFYVDAQTGQVISSEKNVVSK